MKNPYQPKLSAEYPPPTGQVIIAWDAEGNRNQVEIREDGTCFKWGYEGKSRGEWIHSSEIVKWRGCSGFDF